MPVAQHFYFLENRSSETLDTVRKCFGKSDPKEVPFRVIVSVESEARRNNVAEALLRMRNPLLRLIWITTRTQIEADPFDSIYLTPLAYRQAVEGSVHAIENVRPEERVKVATNGFVRTPSWPHFFKSAKAPYGLLRKGLDLPKARLAPVKHMG